MKREALEKLLLEKHRNQLDNADQKEKKRIKKQIEKLIEQELKEDFKKVFDQKPWIR